MGGHKLVARVTGRRHTIRPLPWDVQAEPPSGESRAVSQEASDEGVASVLLASLQVESDNLSTLLAERDREVEELKQRCFLLLSKNQPGRLQP